MGRESTTCQARSTEYLWWYILHYFFMLFAILFVFAINPRGRLWLLAWPTKFYFWFFVAATKRLLVYLMRCGMLLLQEMSAPWTSARMPSLKYQPGRRCTGPGPSPLPLPSPPTSLFSPPLSPTFLSPLPSPPSGLLERRLSLADLFRSLPTSWWVVSGKFGILAAKCSFSTKI